MQKKECLAASVFPLPRGGGVVLHEVVGASRDVLLRHLALLSSPRDRNGNPGPPRYPGPNPVSMERASLGAMTAASRAGTLVFVAPKTDGVRAALMAVTVEGRKVIVLWTRRLACYLLPLARFPRVAFQGTLLDGELVANASSGRVDYLAFDVVAASGARVLQRPFSGRIAAARHALADYTACDSDPIGLVVVKSFVPLGAALFPSVRALLADETYVADGLVFVPEALGVVYGRHETFLKWKTRHTIDFVFTGGALHVYDAAQRANRPIHGALESLKQPPPDGTVVECELVDAGVWRLVGTRADKSRGNDSETFRRTMTNILENISLDDIERAL